MVPDWMITADEFIDVHAELHDYGRVVALLRTLEERDRLKKYFNGHNSGARWFFQVYSREFVEELAGVINGIVQSSGRMGPVLEVMSGDGRLRDFLEPQLQRDMIATDMRSGRYNIAYPKEVAKIDALSAVETYNPSVVVCSWEPFLSMTGIEIANSGIPFIWIGDPEVCGHPDLFTLDHITIDSRYALGKHDSFNEQEFRTEIHVFNCSPS
ncbi:hypothetical protein EU520_01215 [Candidatus Thorarchaeota archaeon]|nr:MAG: hypothetical protein EU520_01215 [Candidatus Thorarchaeota archaeon]